MYTTTVNVNYILIQEFFKITHRVHYVEHWNKPLLVLSKCCLSSRIRYWATFYVSSRNLYIENWKCKCNFTWQRWKLVLFDLSIQNHLQRNYISKLPNQKNYIHSESKFQNRTIRGCFTKEEKENNHQVFPSMNST